MIPKLAKKLISSDVHLSFPFSDRVQATLGEGTFGKVVKVKDVTKSR